MADLHLDTPLLHSRRLSQVAGRRVHLKMDALQPTGSFKIRGIGRACTDAAAQGARRLLSSSGGNAGLAVAYAGRQLGLPVEVFVPGSTSEFMREVIRSEGAEVQEHGAAWDDAHAAALRRMERGDCAYIHPFDDPRIWAGHASLVAEVQARGLRPDAVLVSVGGGGLLCGVLQGMAAAGWQEVPVLAVETEGAASLQAAASAGRPVEIPAITSIATTLGARQVADEAYAWLARHPVHLRQVSDAAAVAACARFLDLQRVLVEPACGAALACLEQEDPVLAAAEDVLVVVCGGAGASRDLLDAWLRAV